MSSTGYRNIAFQRAIWNVSWLVGGTTTVPDQDPDELLIRCDKADGSAADIYLAAVGFNPTLPGWTAEGYPWSTRYYALCVYVAHPTYPCTLLCKVAASPLTAGMTCGALDTAWAAGTQTPAATTLTIDRGGVWHVYYGLSADTIANGLMFGLASSAAGSFIFDATLGSIDGGYPMVAMDFYGYDLRHVPAGTDVERIDTTAIEDYLNGSIPAYVQIAEATIEHSEIDTLLPDADVSDRVQGGGDITLQASCPAIESWTTGTEPFGTLSVALPTDAAGSNIIDTEQYRRLRGTPITVEMDIVRPDNGAALAEMSTIRAIAGHAEQTTGQVDIELISPAATDLDGPPRRFWAGEMDGPTPDDLQYDAGENAALILFDLLMNVCPSTRWSNMIHDDWFWLVQRFAGTWGAVEMTDTQTLAASTVRELFDGMLATLCLCCGTDLDGNVTVWHPAAYRPSMRCWTLNPLEEHASGLKLVGLETDQYDIIEVPYQSTYTETFNSNRDVRGLDAGRVYSHTWPIDYLRSYSSGVDWTARPFIRDALARQLGQRMFYPAVHLSFSIGLRGLTWRLGDQLVITSPLLGLTAKPFMVTRLSASPLASTVEVEAVHYTGWPGGHSRFEEAGPLGLYRWRRRQWGTHVSATEDPTLDNLTWGADKTMDMVLGGPGSTWDTIEYGSWEGAAMYIEETGTVDGHGDQATAVTYAGCQLPTQGGTYPNQVDVHVWTRVDLITFVGDKEYDWLWRWWNTGTGAGLALLARNTSAPGYCVAGSCRLVLAHCTNCNPGIGLWGGANIVASIEAPFGMRASVAYENAPAAVSVAWDAEDSARLYVGQRLAGALTSTPVPASMNAFEVRTPLVYTGEYIYNLFTRLSYRATTPGAELMLPDDGLDPYYP